MKAAVLYGPRDVRVEEVDRPALGPGDVLLRVRACGICGSDLHVYKHGMFTELGAPVNGGRILGHEFSGEVAAIEGQVAQLAVGDAVTAIAVGAAAEYLRIPAPMAPLIRRLPTGLSFEEAATTEPLATSLHAVRLANVQNGQTVVIIGAGIIGLGVLQLLKAFHSLRVIIVDLSSRRLAMASDLGADAVVNAAQVDAYQRVLELTGATAVSFVEGGPAAGVDVVFDCAGVSREHAGPSTLEQALLMVRENGTVVMVAVSERPFPVDFNVLMRKGIRLLGSWAWSLPEFDESLGLISSGTVARRPLITHEFPLDQAAEAYETQLRAEEAIKVLIKP